MMLGLDVYGKTLGIIGFGRIGRAVARRAIRVRNARSSTTTPRFRRTRPTAPGLVVDTRRSAGPLGLRQPQCRAHHEQHDT